MQISVLLIDSSFQGESICPEDYTSLFGWTSFRWVTPLITRGTYQTLNEKDVWKLSPILAAKPCFIKFTMMKCVPEPAILQSFFTKRFTDATPYSVNFGLRAPSTSCKSYVRA